MICSVVVLPTGERAIICGGGRRRRCGCGKRATQRCDWKVPGGTCDVWLCTSCSHVPAAGKDLCPTHAATWQARLDAKA